MNFPVSPTRLESPSSRPSQRHELGGPAWLNSNAARTARATQTEKPPTLQYSKERLAGRWYALNGLFARRDADRQPEPDPDRENMRHAPMVVVYSLAGGVGKTSLVATLGRSLSSLGEKVLLTDTTAHGLLPFYFGANKLVPGVVRTFLPPSGSTDAPVNVVSYRLVSPGPEGPWSGSHEAGRGSDDRDAEIDRQTRMVDDLLTNSQRATRVLLDINPDSDWLIKRLSWLKPLILIPVIADISSVITIQAVEETFRTIKDADGRPLQPVYLLNQFDATLPLHLDIREVLRQQLGERLLPLVVRRSSAVSEALAEGMTIVDYDPDSGVTQDCISVANWLRGASSPAMVGFRNLRWSEQ